MFFFDGSFENFLKSYKDVDFYFCFDFVEV